ncbi:putative zinc finger protein [Phaeomoniella chlamydospora]|uniref:Ubiquitin thioesterase OTU n=1 Tax=Phaeomoniella chlamydospora TaxID=158046 RepID=A0A0G2DVR8_PHACM|nr:putative zinc finger protein [Phaeomoniella chlamydospora]
MRIRLRGPSGQSTLTLEDTSTVSQLLDEISSQTSIPKSSLIIKYGYPPKPLEFPPSSETLLLSDLQVRLNGEQLIVSRGSASPGQGAAQRSSETTVQQGPVTDKAAQLGNQVGASSSQSGFSFGGYGSAPPSQSTGTGSGAAAPLSLQRKSIANVADDPPEVIMPENGGTLVLRIMPDDNSCLFRAIAQAVTPHMDTMNELRSIVAQNIQAHPDKYSKVVLDDKEPDDYCRWIQTEDAWGGQIELDILSTHFDIEICSIDVQTLRVDRYNEGMMTRCVVVYSGIHYDTIALAPFDMPPEADVKVFDTADDGILASALALCQTLQDRHYYTDTAGFQIRCNDCGSMVTGERGATEHAVKTGHYNFGEAS